jgi:ribulose-phosphate 3-epimerase
MISVHQEATPHLDRTLNAIRGAGAQCGVVVNPATPVSTLGEVLPQVDFVLVMSVNPGFGGQTFIHSALGKLEQLKAWRAERGWGFRLEVDGGIGVETIGEAAKAGADILVAGTSIFNTPDPSQRFAELQRAASLAVAEKV